MRTEQLVRQDRPRDVHRVSTALEDWTPPAWHLVTSKGKPAALSSAGFVLHFGHTYQLRVAGSESGPAPEVHLVRVPPFIERQDGPATVSRHGQEFACMSFRVHREAGWLRFYQAPTELLFGDLELEWEAGAGAERRRVPFGCPVVARTRWTVGIIILLSAWALLTWLIGQLQHAAAVVVTRGELPLESNPRFWLWPLLLAGSYPLYVLVLHIGRLRQRSEELEARYLRRYLPAP